ncbi:MAG: hypothetical protein LCH37_15565 [Bacteroidetes bacterium]|nr:hypothetical protein [Bacteroidota bacterium]
MYSADFLRDLAKDKVTGDFYPFDTGNIENVINYIRQLVGSLSDNPSLIIEPDFDYYGSGFASYIPVRVSKRDNSDSTITTAKNRVSKETKGILLYISNLTPFWYFGGSEWSVTTENGRQVSGSSGFLFPEDNNAYDTTKWETDMERIKFTLNQFNYQLLKQDELETPLDFDLTLASNFITGKPRVFDCFFHWND